MFLENHWKSMQEFVRKSFEIYARIRWDIEGNLSQTSLESRWSYMREIVGKSLEIYAESRWTIVGNLCRNR